MSMSATLFVVMRSELELAVAANAGAVLGLALGARLENSLGAEGKDAGRNVTDGSTPHTGPTLAATGERVRRITERAYGRGRPCVGFNGVARRSRSFVDYRDRIAATEAAEMGYVGLAVFGPKKDVNKLSGKLSLAG